MPDSVRHTAGTSVKVAGVFPSGLLGLTSRLAPALVSGNTAIVVAGETSPLASIAMAEAFATSDIPGGVANVLAGSSTELLPRMLGHRDIDAVDLTGSNADLDASVVGEAADNLKRLVRGDADEQSPYVVADFCEMKTVWHPVGR